MKLFLSAALSVLISVPAGAEGLKDYKNQKHRPLKTNSSGEVVSKTCYEAYVESCQRSCADDACRSRCTTEAGPYCEARSQARADVEGRIALYALLLAAGPLITLIDGPRRYADGNDTNPFGFYWNLPSYQLDLGLGLLQGNTYGISSVGSFRFGHFGAGFNAAYFNQGGDTLGEYDIGPTFSLGSTMLSGAISPVAIGSTGRGVKHELGFGVRTSTTAYAGPLYFLFSPLLGKINHLWQFSLRMGLGYRFTSEWAAHLTYEHRGVLDVDTLAISTASLNGGFLYLSYRVN